jgi:hypothetical protein
MNRHMRLACIALTLGLLAGTTTADVLVDILPSELTINVGESVTFDIVADMSLPIMGWELDLSIADPTVASVAAPPIVAPPWSPVSSDGDGLGGIVFPTSVMGDDIALATISIQGDAIGDTIIDVSTNAPDEGFLIDAFAGGGMDTWTSNATMLHVVPEPAVPTLMAMVGLLLRRR